LPLLLKVSPYDFDSASRDQREMAAAAEAGFDIKILADIMSIESDKVENLTIKGFDVCRFFLMCPRSFAKYFYIIPRTFRIIRKIRSYKADVISCHDITLLIITYLSTFFIRKSNKPKLIYDSHEFELGRYTVKPRSRFWLWIIKHTERFLMKRSVFSIMVNDSIADEVVRIHNLKTRPIVIRNIPPNWKIDPTVTRKHREEIAELAGTSSSSFFAMYHGYVQRNRGIEVLIKAIQTNQNMFGVVMGSAMEEAYLDGLKAQAKERVIFIPAAPNNRIWEYAGAVDVEVMVIGAEAINDYLCLPNKFCESVQSLTPIVASDFPEMERLIEQYDIGLTCDPTNNADINDCLERMRTDKEMYARFKSNIVKAKEDLCWENEKAKLVEAYTAVKEEL